MTTISLVVSILRIIIMKTVVMLLAIVLMQPYCFVEAQHVEWSLLEKKTRKLLSLLAMHYEMALIDMERSAAVYENMDDDRRKLLRDNLPEGKVHLSGIKAVRDSVILKPIFASLWEGGHVVFFEESFKNHKEKDPVLVYVSDDASSLLRVVYTWDSDLRIVRRGTKEYERISERVFGANIPEKNNYNAELILKPIRLKVVDESNYPIRGQFNLRELDNGTSLSSWFRGAPVGKKGEIFLEDTPRFFELDFISSDNFYTTNINSKLSNTSLMKVIRVFPSGTLGFIIKKCPENFVNPIVAICYKKVDGEYVKETGFGIVPSLNHEYTFIGLTDGIYKVHLKHGYEDNHSIAMSKEVKVKAKKHVSVFFDILDM